MAAPQSPKDADLRAVMSEILKSSELAQLTSRIVRSKLEEKFRVNLRDRKKDLDNMLMEMIEEEQAKDEDEKYDNEQIVKVVDDNRVKKNPKGSDKEEETEELEDQPSPKKQKMVSNPQVEEKSEQNLQQSDSDEDVNDEELARKLQKNERCLRARTQRKTREKKVAKSRKSSDGEKKADRRGTGFGKPMVLSEQLAAVVGVNMMSRSDVVKRMWEIIKERKLEDPKNKRFTICDEELASLFGRKRIQTFGMMKYLKRHIKDPELIV